jgi:DNA-binding NtrC family response regulator
MNSYLSEFDRWADKRITLKHNWFDRLATSLRSFPVGGELPPPLRHWNEDYPKLVSWISEATAALSPRQILDLPAFASWPDDFRKSYQKFLHDRFLKSAPDVPGIVSDCVLKLKDLNVELSRMLKGGGPVLNKDRREDISSKLEYLARRLRELPEQIAWPEEPEQQLSSIFVIDDLLGRLTICHQGKPVLTGQAEAEIREFRRSFCERFHLLDNDFPGDSEYFSHPIARAYFSASQRYDPQRGFVNDLDVLVQDLATVGPEGSATPWALVIADVLFNTGQPSEYGRGSGESQFGVEYVIPWLKRNVPALPIVALTTESGQSLIQKVNDLGVEYLHRSESSHVDMLIQLARGGQATAAQLRKSMNVPENFIAEDPRMVDVLLEAWNVAHDDAGSTVLITGEPGAGKERLAEFIHQMSSRKREELVIVNCAQYSKDLADSELFGYYAKAFSGADERDTPGIFHAANKSTLVLDEFADLDRDVQAKLLRTLEPKRAEKRPVEPRGNRRQTSKLATTVDVRIICCTNQPLSRVREDLRTRVGKIIEIPPLRERPADIVAMARHFLASSDRINAPGLSLDDEACRFLQTSDLPGNARTLEQLLEVARSGKGKRNIIRREDLERAWSSVFQDDTLDDDPSQLVTTASLQPATQPARLSSQTLANGDQLSWAVATILASVGQGQNWENLSRADTDALDDALKGRVMQVISTLVEWSLFRAEEAPEIANYLTGKKTAGRTPQDLVRRLFKLDLKVFQDILASPYFPENDTLKAIRDQCAEEWAKRKGSAARERNAAE